MSCRCGRFQVESGGFNGRGCGPRARARAPETSPGGRADPLPAFPAACRCSISSSRGLNVDSSRCKLQFEPRRLHCKIRTGGAEPLGPLPSLACQMASRRHLAWLRRQWAQETALRSDDWYSGAATSCAGVRSRIATRSSAARSHAPAGRPDFRSKVSCSPGA